MRLRRSEREPVGVSLVSMVDVLMIMLVFFMVTSTYLNLDMIPIAGREDPAAVPDPPEATAETGRPILLRLAADGVVYFRGRAHDADALESDLRLILTEDPTAEVLVLPSARAETQALVAVMDSATRAGALELRIVRLAVSP